MKSLTGISLFRRYCLSVLRAMLTDSIAKSVCRSDIPETRGAQNESVPGSELK